MIIRQSTARTVLVGPVLDSTGAAKTDEVVGSIKVTKNGTVAAADGSATLTHDHAGKYKLALTANDCDTVGVLEISLNSGTNDMPVKACNVIETAIWDALFADGATGLLPANVTQFGGANLTSASGIPEVKVASMAANTLTAAAISADAGAELAALVETYIVNEGDATAVMQAIADKIAADWVAGDASPVAVATAVWAVATRTITGGSLTTSPPTAAVIADAVWDEARSGHVTSGTFGEKVNAELDSAAINAVADQVWDEAMSGHTTAGTYGGRIVRATNSNTEVQITGSNHIAADVHEFQTGVITAGDFAANSITASALATDAVTEIQSGLATSAALATAKAILDKVDTGLVVDGAVYQFTANMLELGPSGSSTVTVLPATGIVADRSAGTTLTPVVGETISQSITVYQSDGTTAVNLSAKTLKVIFETMSGVDVAVVLAADITISGASSNVVTFAYPSAVTASERTLRFAIRDAAAPLTMYLQGVCSVVAAPKVDA